MRRETGVLKQPGDWPGFFLRGDDAMFLAQDMRWIANSLADGSISRTDVAVWMHRRAEIFAQVHAKDRDPPPPAPKLIWGDL